MDQCKNGRDALNMEILLTKAFDAERSSADETSEFLRILTVRETENDVFEGAALAKGVGRVFGGQVVAQALAAAEGTVELSKSPHSFHAYFMRAGDATEAISYVVERDRDGRNFSTRRVTAVQRGRPILSALANFQVAEGGPSHQLRMPDAPSPEDVAPQVRSGTTKEGGRFRPFEMRPVFGMGSMAAAGASEPATQYWFRLNDRLPEDEAIHRRALAYVSDSNLLGAAMLPHGIGWQTPGTQTASLDHALWIHEPVNLNDWHLYATESPWSGHARGLVRGSIFDRDGKLVASTAQEGLVRVVVR